MTSKKGIGAGREMQRCPEGRRQKVDGVQLPVTNAGPACGQCWPSVADAVPGLTSSWTGVSGLPHQLLWNVHSPSNNLSVLLIII